MDYFPLYFNLRNRRVLIVGGGEVAHRKASLLVRAGAELSVVAPQISPALADLVAANGGQILRRHYNRCDMKGCVLAVSATDDMTLNSRVYQDGRAQGVLVNVVDNPALCDFIFPAIIDRNPMIVAVSSCGVSPVLARRVRAKIEMLLPSALGRLGGFCAKFRAVIKAALPPNRRRIFWEQTLDGAPAQAVLAGDESTAETLLKQSLSAFANNEPSLGEVYLIGAGPGDPDLLTFRAHQLLQKADVVVHDRLVSSSILELARRDAQKIFVGKQRGRQIMPQEAINALLIDLAKRGNLVARLKGGDPFIFGRGGEEMLALQAAAVPFQIVPGITAAMGCAAAAGIPLTHRGVARGARFCAVYPQDIENTDYWRRLAAESDTLIFYMAAAALPTITARLIHAGRCAQTPVAVICAGSTPAQKIIIGDISNIVERTKEQLSSPTLIIIGDVAALGDKSDKAAAMARAIDSASASPFYSINDNHQHNAAA